METKENIPESQPQTVKPVEQTMPPVQDKDLVKPLTSKKFNRSNLIIIAGSFFVVVLGVVTGWFLAGNKQTSNSVEGTEQVTNSEGEVQEAGIGEESEYGTTVEGILKEGGIKGEGTHYIDRDLGESKYVYLTSSVVDLDSFIDRKVVVWGETISAKYASWMIDVGRVKVIK